jgi:hypothetical protein
MAYYLGRDVSVSIGSGDHIGVTSSNGAFTYAGSADNEFASDAGAGVVVTDLTSLDIGIGVTDEDITYLGSKTVLKAEIKKETTISMTRKKTNNVWDAIFNGGARWGVADGAVIANLAGEPDVTTTTSLGNGYFGYQIKLTLSSTESITVPHMQITGHTLALNADGTTEETLEFISQETPTVGA